MNLHDLEKELRRHRSFLISSHMHPEGDALGSELALYFLLKRMGKNAVIYNQDLTPQMYSFLPGIKQIVARKPSQNFDAACLVDCTSIERAGGVKGALMNVGTIINIDHHISNEHFGDINWVNDKASSAAEMIYELFVHCGVVLDKKSALCIYTGIATDTGYFSYNNTTCRVHQIAAELLRFGILPNTVYQEVYSSFSTSDVQRAGKILARLKVLASGKLVVAVIPDWKESLSGDMTDFLFGLLRNIQSAYIFILIKQVSPGTVKLNFRSRGECDVNRLATFFGGGGHPNASGATVKGKINLVRREVISIAEAYLREYQTLAKKRRAQ